MNKQTSRQAHTGHYLQRLFGLEPGQTSVSTEITAGLTTFLTMAYILAVNPDIFSVLQGMPTGAVFTATALAAVIGTLMMALYAKKPFAVAPGMGLNAFFVYTVCGSMGYSWQFALTAIFIEGLIFILLTVTNVRARIVNAVPGSLKNAITCGIGLYMAFIGLKNAGVVVANDATFLSLGKITEGSALLAMIGLFLTGALVALKVKGALLIGMLATTLIGIFMGVTKFHGVVSAPESIAPIFMQFQWKQIFTLDMVIVVFTFLFVDMFNTIGSLVGLCVKTGMVREDGTVSRINQALMADATATTLGACMGASTTTTYIESVSGVAQGGRSGLTAFVTACCFAVALFFAPLFLSIPSAATAPVLVIVGLSMMTSVKNIDLDDHAESIPAFLCMLAMPIAYSIADGILLGIITYVVLNLSCGHFCKLNLTMYILAILIVLKYLFL